MLRIEPQVLETGQGTYYYVEASLHTKSIPSMQVLLPGTDTRFLRWEGGGGVTVKY